MTEQSSVEPSEHEAAFSPTWARRSHEQRVRLLLGWITAFTGIAAAALVTSVVQSIIASVTLANALH